MHVHATDHTDSRLRVLLADVTNVESLNSVLQGAKGVVFAASASSYWSAAAVDFQVQLYAEVFD